MRAFQKWMFLATLTLGACGWHIQEMRQVTTGRVILGYVSFKRAPGPATVLLVEAYYLDEPSDVCTGCTEYVVWISPHDGDRRPRRLGALTLHATPAEPQLSGGLRANSPEAHFDIYITSEASSAMPSPRHQAVLWTSL